MKGFVRSPCCAGRRHGVSTFYQHKRLLQPDSFFVLAARRLFILASCMSVIDVPSRAGAIYSGHIKECAFLEAVKMVSDTSYASTAREDII